MPRIRDDTGEYLVGDTDHAEAAALEDIAIFEIRGLLHRLHRLEIARLRELVVEEFGQFSLERASDAQVADTVLELVDSGRLTFRRFSWGGSGAALPDDSQLEPQALESLAEDDEDSETAAADQVEPPDMVEAGADVEPPDAAEVEFEIEPPQMFDVGFEVA